LTAEFTNKTNCIEQSTSWEADSRSSDL